MQSANDFSSTVDSGLLKDFYDDKEKTPTEFALKKRREALKQTLLEPIEDQAEKAR